MRVIKKVLRSAMCLYGYFDLKAAEIIFAAPKINNSAMAANRFIHNLVYKSLFNL